MMGGPNPIRHTVVIDRHGNEIGMMQSIALRSIMLINMVLFMVIVITYFQTILLQR